MKTRATPVVIRFRENHAEVAEESVELREDLSSVEVTGRNIWLVSDEAKSIERLTRVAEREFSGHVAFGFSDLIDLPAGKDEEIDIEALASDGRFMWVVGSHSLKRKSPKKGTSMKEKLERLATIKKDRNRWFLARIPLLLDRATGDYKLVKQAGNLKAARLTGEPGSNELIELLRHDEHLAASLNIPGKENGFDVEGLACCGGDVLLGLRGPVIKGYATLLRIRPDGNDDKLKLKRLSPHGPRYAKHFLDLGGLGIRDLAVKGNDILILAGPAMHLDGTFTVYRWVGGARSRKDSVLEGSKELRRLFDVVHGGADQDRKDHAEGIAVLRGRGRSTELLVVYDSPETERLRARTEVEGDVFKIAA